MVVTLCLSWDVVVDVVDGKASDGKIVGRYGGLGAAHVRLSDTGTIMS